MSSRASAPTCRTGDDGGTGIALYKDGLYAEVNDRIVRYALPPATIAPTGASRKSSSPACRSPAIIRCILSRSTHKGALYRRPRLGDQFLPGGEPHAESPGHRPLHRTGNPRRHLALRRQQDLASNSRRPSVSPPACAMARAFPSTRQAACSRPSTAATNCRRTGPSSTRASRAPNCRPRNWSNSNRAPISAGLNATSTASRRSSCSRRNMAATAARRSAFARRSRRPSRAFPPIGRPTTCRSTTARLSRSRYRGGAFIAFHGSWNRAPCRKAAIMSCSSRWPTARLRANSSSSPMASPAPNKDPAGPRIAPRAWRSGRTARFIFPTTSMGASGASPIRATTAALRGGAGARAADASLRPLPPEGIHPDAGEAMVAAAPPGAKRNSGAGRTHFPGRGAAAPASAATAPTPRAGRSAPT